MPDTSSRRRLVALHGFTQTHHHWHSVAFRLAASAGFDTVVLPDLPGHGLDADDRRDIDDAAARLPELCGAGTYLGYSMGGRFALAAAIARPDAVDRLVLIGATAGIDDPDDRAERRRLDSRRADQLEQGVDGFLDRWLAMPMFSGLPDDPGSLEHRRRNTAAGLAHSLRACGTGTMSPLWDRVGEIAAPTLVVVGEQDTKFTAIGARLASSIADATYVEVPGAGHAAHTERPDETLEIIASWLTEHR